MRTNLTALACFAVLGVSGAWADPSCTCRAPGVTAELGQTVCIKTPSGLRLARCEMVLNNTSWRFLSDSCPEASLPGRNVLVAARTLMPDTPPALR